MLESSWEGRALPPTCSQYVAGCDERRRAPYPVFASQESDVPDMVDMFTISDK
jgi:hypothetical protein